VDGPERRGALRLRASHHAARPPTLTDRQSIDSIAHMFAVSGMPAGDKELPLDPNALANIMIEAQPR